jgi:hypothetical protein
VIYPNKAAALLLLVFFGCQFAVAQNVRLAVMKYNGGGDWYADPTSLTNLIAFCNAELQAVINPTYDVVEVGSSDLFLYPFIHMTGHGNVVFSKDEAKNLRTYLISGGFLHIDDNYGMDPYVRLEMKKVFPELEWIELPKNHPIYNQRFNFPEGLPKIHEHDGKPAQGFGLFWEGRLVCYYTYQTDLSDGWEDAEVHNNPEKIRQIALKMGANIVEYALMQN